jgi:hypothetical protein
MIVAVRIVAGASGMLIAELMAQVDGTGGQLDSVYKTRDSTSTCRTWPLVSNQAKELVWSRATDHPAH